MKIKKAIGVAMVIGAMAYCMIPDIFADRKVSKEITDDPEVLKDIAGRDIDDPEVLKENLNKLKAERDRLMQRLSIQMPSLETYQLLSVRLNQLNQTIRLTERRLSDV